MKNEELEYEEIVLTPETFATITNECSDDIKAISIELEELYNDLSDNISAINEAKAKIKELKKEIRNLKDTKREINYEISKDERVLKVDTDFMCNLSKKMNNHDKTFIVNYDKKKIYKSKQKNLH